ncbi:MAG: hypothetical protein ACKOPS_26210 [Cyanobium sp.]
MPQGSPIRTSRSQEAANPRSESARTDSVSDADCTPNRPPAGPDPAPSRGRDNTSRFDD